MTEVFVSIAVLPFENLSSEPDTDYFARGFVDDLTGGGPRFVRILAWASFTAARRFAAIVADKVNPESGAAQPPRAISRCASRAGGSVQSGR